MSPIFKVLMTNLAKGGTHEEVPIEADFYSV